MMFFLDEDSIVLVFFLKRKIEWIIVLQQEVRSSYNCFFSNILQDKPYLLHLTFELNG